MKISHRTTVAPVKKHDSIYFSSLQLSYTIMQEIHIYCLILVLRWCIVSSMTFRLLLFRSRFYIAIILRHSQLFRLSLFRSWNFPVLQVYLFQRIDILSWEPDITTLVEVTNGNLGIGVGFIAGQEGYKFIAVMPGKFSLDKQILYLGAEVILKLVRS